MIHVSARKDIVCSLLYDMLLTQTALLLFVDKFSQEVLQDNL